jgi:hypothetical protein
MPRIDVTPEDPMRQAPAHSDISQSFVEGGWLIKRAVAAENSECAAKGRV